MKNNRPLIVGIFIIIGIAILIVTIFTLGGQKKTFVKTFTINAVFNDVGGLLKGGNVWFSGVKIGTIKEMSFSKNDQVQVSMSIENKVQSHIHKNAFAKIGSDGLIGNKIIIIYGGDSSFSQVEKNDYLAVVKSISTDDMLETLQANNKNLLEITQRFKNISKKIDSGNGSLAILLNDGSMANKINNTVEHLSTTVSNFKAASLTTNNILNDFKNFTEKINKPGNSVNDLVIDTVIYKKLKGTIFQLRNAADTFAVFSTNLKKASERLNQKNNTVGAFLNDSIMIESIKITLKNMETSSQKLDEDLEALQHNIFLRGFFKKKEKEKQLQK